MQEVINEIYTEVQPEFERIIYLKALRLGRWVPLHDAMQEGRQTVWRALRSFDASKCDGELKRYIGVCVDNAFRELYNRETRQRRTPRATVDRGFGWERVPMKPVELDRDGLQYCYADQPSPEDILTSEEDEEEIKAALFKVWETLGEREQMVMECMVWPVDSLETRNDRTPNVAIASFLGLTKNQVDYSVAKVRAAIRREVVEGGFSERIRHAVAKMDAANGQT